MTNSTNKLRSLFLAMLMVLSVVGGSVAFAGTAAANAPDSGAYAAGNAPGGDATPTTDTTTGLTTKIADVGFQTPGNVTHVEVNASYGSDANGIDTSDIESVSVILLDNNNGTVAESGQVIYDEAPVNVSFEGTDATTGDEVGRLQVLAKVSSSASDGDAIDAGVTVTDTASGTQFEGNTPYDTAGSQTVVISDTFVSAQVKRTGANGSTVEDATVQFVNNDTGTIIAERITQSSGATSSVRVAPGVNIRADANKGGFTKSSSQIASVPRGESRELDVTITPEGVAKNIEIIAADPASESAIANGTDQVTYYAQVTGQFGEQEDQPLDGFDVSSAVENDPNTGSVTLSPGTDTTQEVTLPDGSTANGTAVFTVSDSEAEQVNVSFTVDDNTTVQTFAQPSFRNERGDAYLQGEVIENTTGSIVGGATVWAAYPGENQTLAYAEQTQPWLVSGVNSEGKYVIEDIVAGDINIYAVADGYNRLNRTGDDVGTYVAADETETVTAGQTENHDLTLEEGGPTQEYRLDVTVDDGNKTVEAPAGTEVTATVTVEQRPEGSSVSYSDAANQDITVETTDNLPLEPDSQNVTTDANGEAQVTFQAENSGETNITASTENSDGDVYNTTGSEEATVSVFSTAEITGDVVNEDDEELARGQATVELFILNETSEYESTGQVSEIGSSGSYVFTNVRSNEQYRMIATTDAGLEGQATTVPNIPSGTTTNDIVVVGAEPSPADFQVSNLNPQNVTVTQGDEITVSATVTNNGSVDDTKAVEFRVGNNVVASQQVSLNVNDSTTVTFENVSTSALSAGTYTHGVYTEDDSQTATLTIESSGNNGETTITDVLNVIQEYNNNNAELGEVLEIIQAYNENN
ncbi:surface glycoprotein [Haloplanus rubicundus]|uniref:CARDB domain-containing protein n=1 Tax=Haloplanus rubicundus TaxID=1547898 RepID=A0A345EBU0_9EURY|nr:surface glycoprotein [Haloplanus rubicundus]AXG09662.1 hypothetical protein DU484_07180 [Haloplanus rubicundus]